MDLNDRLYRILGLPKRALSLRSIVLVASFSVIATVITIGTWVWIGITNEQYSQLDRRLDSISSLGDVTTLLSSALNDHTDEPAANGGLVRTARIAGSTVSAPDDIVLPEFPDGFATTTINGVKYRVRTFSAGQASVALGAPTAETEHQIDAQHRRVLLICGGVIGGTAIVGWIISAS